MPKVHTATGVGAAIYRRAHSSCQTFNHARLGRTQKELIFRHVAVRASHTQGTEGNRACKKNERHKRFENEASAAEDTTPNVFISALSFKRLGIHGRQLRAQLTPSQWLFHAYRQLEAPAFPSHGVAFIGQASSQQQHHAAERAKTPTPPP